MRYSVSNRAVKDLRLNREKNYPHQLRNVYYRLFNPIVLDPIKLYHPPLLYRLA